MNGTDSRPETCCHFRHVSYSNRMDVCLHSTDRINRKYLGIRSLNIADVKDNACD